MNPKIDTVRQYVFDGQTGSAISALQGLEDESQNDPYLLQQIAEWYVQCGQHFQAGRCYQRAADLQPSNPDFLYNLAASKIAGGEIEAAEDILTEVIRLKPDDYGAWLNRSGLKKQTRTENHVEQLRYLLSQMDRDDPASIPVFFALAKELEDLQQYPDSFTNLQSGAHLRRLGMRYDVQEDEQVMAEIARTFSPGLLNQAQSMPSVQQPIFILGLPRSGTTLVDRIISSHSSVESLGEHNTLPLAIMKMIGQNSAGPGSTVSKIGSVQQAARLDFAELGRRYGDSINGFGSSAERLIDKTPTNFLYLGIIQLALPGAKIIHMRRHPLDSCYAIYKTLFRAGYPFSYSLQETGRYFVAYDRLMSHWRDNLQNAILEVNYEDLVHDQETQTHRILDYLELPWEDGCLAFHEQGGHAATASAAQVRQPIYSSSVGMWRNYSQQLAPLAGKLRQLGIDVD